MAVWNSPAVLMGHNVLQKEGVMMDHEWNAFSEKVAQGLREYVEHPDRVLAAMRETIRHA
jgi:hypothetical protein